MNPADRDGVYTDLSEVTFHCISNDEVVLILPRYRTIYFNGIIDVQLLSGVVEVLGHILLSDKLYTLFSPKGTSLLGIDAIGKSKTNTEVIKSDHSSLILQILSRYQSGNCLLLLKRNRNHNGFIEFLKRYVPFQLFPTDTYVTEVENNLHCLLETANTRVKRFIKLKEWKSVESVITKCIQSETAPRLVLCGGTGVGKSTLLRYLVNKALNVHEKVLVLDFDPGQSEFTVMGCVSAVVVDKPVFGPNFCHLQNPAYSLYLGEIAINSCITEYLTYVQKVINFYKSNDEVSALPCIVNTMGYSKGLGVKLISSVICAVSPTDVVQINSKYRDCNFPSALTEKYVSSENVLLPEIKLERDYKLHEIISACDEDAPQNHGQPMSWGLKSALKRNIVTLSYFFRALDDSDTYLTECEPYGVSASLLEIIVSPSQCKFTLEEKLQIINGNMISLCRKDTDDTLNCCGFGIVRATDLQRLSLYVITPLTEKMLTNVNAIVMRESVCLPRDVYLLQYQHVSMCDEIPFTQCSSSDNDLNKEMRRTFRPVNRNPSSTSRTRDYDAGNNNGCPIDANDSTVRNTSS